MGLLSKIISLGIILSRISPQLKSLRSNKESSIDAEEPSEQALLTEYQVCQKEACECSQATWQSGVIFFVTALALAAAIISRITSADYNIYRLFLIAVFGTFSIVLLIVWDKYIIRQNFIRWVMFHRMEMIERQLKMRKNLYTSFLDETLKDCPLSKEDQNRLTNIFGKRHGRKPQGLKWTRLTVWVTIAAWALFMIWELIVFLSPSFRSWVIMTN